MNKSGQTQAVSSLRGMDVVRQSSDGKPRLLSEVVRQVLVKSAAQGSNNFFLMLPQNEGQKFLVLEGTTRQNCTRKCESLRDDLQ